MKKFTALLVLMISSTGLYAQGKTFKTDDGAIKGYDPVAYFTDSKPVKGKKAHAFEWNDATWYFASADNLNKFKANPDEYAPQYGGFCAFGLAQGYKVKIEPEAWAIIDDKLYLNYDLDVQKKWNKKQAQFIAEADKRWPELKNQ